MGVTSSFVLGAREVLLHDDVERLSEWLVSRARHTGNSQHDLVKKKDILHLACEMGAVNCVRYIADVFPSAVNTQDKAGRSPLQCALLGEADNVHYACAFTLLDSESTFNKMAFLTREGSILHNICSDCHCPDQAKVIKMVLGKAGRKLTRSLVNQNGDTPLHALFKLTKLYEHIMDSDGNINLESTPLQKYFAVVRVCTELLLSKGCDPNKVNHQGQTPLSVLLVHGQQLKAKVDLDGHPKVFSAFVRGINWVMEVMMKYKANPNVASPSGEVPLVTYAKTLQRCQNGTKDLLNGLRLLCDHGADPNLPLNQRDTDIHNDESTTKPRSRNVYRQILTTCLSHSLRNNRYHAPDVSTIRFLRQSYQLLKTYGLNTNRIMTHDLKLLLPLIAFSRFPLDPAFVDEFKQLLRDMFVTGGDPNLIPILPASEETGFSVPENLQRAFLMQEDADIMGVVHVLYCSLDQQNLNNLIGKTLQELDKHRPGQLADGVASELSELTKHPRSLQDLTRVTIHKAVNWKLAECEEGLNLPPLLKRYLYDFD